MDEGEPLAYKKGDSIRVSEVQTGMRVTVYFNDGSDETNIVTHSAHISSSSNNDSQRDAKSERQFTLGLSRDVSEHEVKNIVYLDNRKPDIL